MVDHRNCVSSELSRDGVADLIIDLFKCLTVDLADAAESSTCHKVAFGIKILGLGEIRQDIVFFIGERQVEGFWPEGDINEGMPGGIGVKVQVVDPGTFHGPHVED